ncbi:MAG: FTR1 family iron permease [Dictyoglomaceae bacterium]
MMAQFLIVFRESLEAMLILGIILAYLKRTGRESAKKEVWIGTGFSILLGILLSIIIFTLYGGIKEKELFEGIASYLAVIVLTSVIYWMSKKGRYIKEEIESKVSKSLNPIALILFSFVIIFREVLETILFLIPFFTKDLFGTLFSFTLGIVSAFLLTYLIYTVGLKINLKSFFYYTSILLIFIASGLIGYGTHELIEFLEEKGISLYFLGEEAYSLPISQESIFYHKGAVGSIFAILFGYSTSMEWGRLILQTGYLLIFISLIRAKE